MERLAILILHEELCGVGKDVVGGIINRKKKDVKLSTIISICENSDIKLEDVFLKKKSEPQETYLIMNGERYLIELHKVRTTP